MSTLATLLGDLVAIDSVNPDLVPGGAGEGAIAAFVARWLEAAGVEVTVQETAAGRPNVIGRVRGTGGGRSLMLNAHMDTVGLGGRDGALTPRIDGNRLYGRGAFDMKGSLAAIMLVAAEVVRAPLAGDLLVTAVTDEEYAAIGTQAITRAYTADAAIITEPSGLEVCIAHKGFVWADIATFGLAAHGSLPAVGIDAITRMGRVLVGLEGVDRALRAGPSHPLLATGSVHASLISGGIELSTYPDLCRLQLERRTIPGETAAVVEAQLRALLADAGRDDPTFRAKLTMGIVRNPFQIAPDAPIVTTVVAAANSVTGASAALTGAFGWMDSAILSEAGIPTVIYGPSGAGAHAESEWVDLDTVEQARQVYIATARAFCV